MCAVLRRMNGKRKAKESMMRMREGFSWWRLKERKGMGEGNWRHAAIVSGVALWTSARSTGDQLTSDIKERKTYYWGRMPGYMGRAQWMRW